MPESTDETATAETTETEVSSTAEAPIQLPDDHPLVKTLAKQYDQIKALKATQIDPQELARLKKLDDESKTEAQRSAEEVDRLRKENETLKATTLRAEVAAEKGVPANLLAGSTREEFEAAADALLAFRGDKPKAPSADGQGNTGSSVSKGNEQSADDWLRGLAN